MTESSSQLIHALAVSLVIGILAGSVVPATGREEHRSTAVASEFQREHPCPATRDTRGACPGYVKDHVRPLACGGPDAVDNIQWQTAADAKAKDRWERRDCLNR
jgi:hypothetical protein